VRAGHGSHASNPCYVAMKTRQSASRLAYSPVNSGIHGYMTSAFYIPSALRGVRFNDPACCIHWPCVATVV
jgi:hypothetical protein